MRLASVAPVRTAGVGVGWEVGIPSWALALSVAVGGRTLVFPLWDEGV